MKLLSFGDWLGLGGSSSSPGHIIPITVKFVGCVRSPPALLL